MMKSQKVLAAVIALTLAVSTVFAGTITGTVKFEGTPPEMKPLPISADPACAAMHKDSPILNETLVLGEGQTMGNVLVTITKGLPQQSYTAPSEPFVVTQKGCQFSPHVFAVQAGQPIKVLNPDGILHNVNMLAKTNKPENKAMPKELTELQITFPKAEAPFEVKCDIHPWMRAYCAVVDHPYFFVTGKDGVYKIENLPAGEYEVTVWHERLRTQTATVKVDESGTATQDFSYSRPTPAATEKKQ